MVDDGSTHEWLTIQLPVYVKTTWPAKVRLIRSPNRVGVLQARLMGTRHSKGAVLTFLDSHCEVNIGWYEPLASIIFEDEQSIAVPVIDAIDADTLVYNSNKASVPSVGSFTWGLDFSWKPARVKEGATPSDPITCPVIPGGTFSITRAYFQRIGQYDEELNGMHIENIELSFRAWLCGGSIYMSSCSHIGHIFKPRMPAGDAALEMDAKAMLRDYVRTAELWFGNYKDNFYQVKPAARAVKPGDTSQRDNMKRALKCRDFRWYLLNVARDIFIPETMRLKNKGAIKGSSGECLDRMGRPPGSPIGLYACHGKGVNQVWMLTKEKEIRSLDGMCFDYFGGQTFDVKVVGCHNSRGNQVRSEQKNYLFMSTL